MRPGSIKAIKKYDRKKLVTRVCFQMEESLFLLRVAYETDTALSNMVCARINERSSNTFWFYQKPKHPMYSIIKVTRRCELREKNLILFFIRKVVSGIEILQRKVFDLRFWEKSYPNLRYITTKHWHYNHAATITIFSRFITSCKRLK